MPRLPDWMHRADAEVSDNELKSTRQCVGRGRPLGQPAYVESTDKRLYLELTLRSRGNEATPAMGNAGHAMRDHAYQQTSGEGPIYQWSYKTVPVQSDEYFHTDHAAWGIEPD